MKNLILLGFILLSISSCKKESGLSPILPNDYFPAYPGSYWIYSNGDTTKVADSYQEYTYNIASYGFEPIWETILVPKLIYSDSIRLPRYIKGRYINSGGNSYFAVAFLELFSEEKGYFKVDIPHSGTLHRMQGVTIKTDTSIWIENINYSNVIATHIYDEYWGSQYPIIREYYAKGVGLIRRDSRNFPIDTVFTIDSELIDYKIKW